MKQSQPKKKSGQIEVDYTEEKGNKVNHKKDPQEERVTTGEKEEIESTAKEKWEKRG